MNHVASVFVNRSNKRHLAKAAFGLVIFDLKSNDPGSTPGLSTNKLDGRVGGS